MKASNQAVSAISLLYVEDDQATRETISSVISKKFASMLIHTAENGAVGLELFKEYRPDIVLTDISMPVMDGIQMARNIRKLNVGANIIAASALSGTQNLMDVINTGINRYVLKPINFKLLFTAIEECIAGITRQRRAKSETEGVGTFSRALEQSPGMVMIADASGAIEYVNPSFTARTGYDLQEVSGQHLRLLMTCASPVDTFEAIWSAITGGVQWRGEILNRKKDGELYREEISIFPLRSDTGQITHFVAMMDDVSGPAKVSRSRAVPRNLETGALGAGKQ